MRNPRQRVLEGGVGLVSRLENLQASLPDRVEHTHAALDTDYLLREPEAFILDEPAEGLDVETAQ